MHSVCNGLRGFARGCGKFAGFEGMEVAAGARKWLLVAFRLSGFPAIRNGYAIGTAGASRFTWTRGIGARPPQSDPAYAAGWPGSAGDRLLVSPSAPEVARPSAQVFDGPEFGLASCGGAWITGET